MRTLTLFSVVAVLAVVLVGVIAAALTGCERSDSTKPKPAAIGAVRIVTLSPETTTPLKVGEKVKIQVAVSYRLAADVGIVGLVVQADNSAGLAQKTEPVKKGAGKATLSAEFIVPQARTIQVYTPLQAQGQKETTIVDLRTYKVVAQ
jgi:hypothetical protein